MNDSSPRIAVFPGSFDPFTRGHENIVRKALALFDRLIIAIGANTSKRRFLLTPARRSEAIATLFADQPRIRVETFHGLTVDFCRRQKAAFIVRGIRNATDWAYEQEIAWANRKLAPEIDTVFLAPDPDVSHIRSTIVREILAMGGDVSPFVPPPIVSYLESP